MKLLKAYHNVCYVDKIECPTLPFECRGPMLVGDWVNVVGTLEQGGFESFETPDGMMYLDGKGNYVYAPTLGANFVFPSRGRAADIVANNWATITDVIQEDTLSSWEGKSRFAGAV